VAISK